MNSKEVKRRLCRYLTLYYEKLGLNIKIQERVQTYISYLESCVHIETANLECHHVMPRCCGYHKNCLCKKGEFSEVNCEEDWWVWCETDDNLIKLTVYQHKEAHKLLSRLFPDHIGFESSYGCFINLRRGETELDEEDEARYSEYLKSCAERLHTPEAKRKSYEVHISKYGKSLSCLNNEVTQAKARSTKTLRYGDSAAHMRTKSAFAKSLETRRSHYPESKGMPDSFIQTMTERYGGWGKHTKNLKWITNGHQNRRINKDLELPEGFWLGRTNKRKSL